MSALIAPSDRRESPRESPRTQLRALPRPVRRMARVPFLIVLGLVVALGMVGVLVLNVTIQQQGSRLGDLRAQDEQLGYQQAALQSQVDAQSSTTSLVAQAYKLGMRPNLTPAFIQLKTGKVIGTPHRVTGSELGDQAPQSVEQQAQAIAAAQAAQAAKVKARAAQAKAAAARAAAAAKAKASASATPSATPSTKPSSRPSSSKPSSHGTSGGHR